MLPISEHLKNLRPLADENPQQVFDSLKTYISEAEQTKRKNVIATILKNETLEKAVSKDRASAVQFFRQLLQRLTLEQSAWAANALLKTPFLEIIASKDPKGAAGILGWHMALIADQARYTYANNTLTHPVMDIITAKSPRWAANLMHIHMDEIPASERAKYQSRANKLFQNKDRDIAIFAPTARSIRSLSLTFSKVGKKGKIQVLLEFHKARVTLPERLLLLAQQGTPEERACLRQLPDILKNFEKGATNKKRPGEVAAFRNLITDVALYALRHL